MTNSNLSNVGTELFTFLFILFAVYFFFFSVAAYIGKKESCIYLVMSLHVYETTIMHVECSC